MSARHNTRVPETSTLAMHAENNVVGYERTEDGVVKITITDLRDQVQFIGTHRNLTRLWQQFGEALIHAVGEV